MSSNQKFMSVTKRIILSTLVPSVLIFLLICTVIFVSLFNSLRETAEAELMQISQSYASDFEIKIVSAINYLSIMVSKLEMHLETEAPDRENLQKTALKIFEDYSNIDGSSIYFELNKYDGKDAEYKGTQYGSSFSGRIAYYFYKDGGNVRYLPEALENDEEFEMPHYTEAKEKNTPIYTEPFVYEINGKPIPMFTITYPLHNTQNEFIGAVTTDVFLEDIYAQILTENIYNTGYLLIANDNDQIIYSPKTEDIGKSREEIGLTYELPKENEEKLFLESKSIINSKETLVAINTVFLPQIDARFFISVSAPIEEINAKGYLLLNFLIGLSALTICCVAFLLYYQLDKISTPIKEITQSINDIARGGYSTRITGDYKNEFAIVRDSVNAMAGSIESYVKRSNSSLRILKNILNGIDAFIYVTRPETDEILFINDNMVEHFEITGEPLGEACYKILQDGIDKRCEFCPCYELDKDPDKVIVWEELNSLTNRHYRNTDCYIEWMDGQKVHLRHSVDITDLKTFMNEKLAAEREALEFKHEKEKAEAAAQGKNDFLAKMSHEIRTPMNAVMGMTELILRKDLPQDVYENALMIKSASSNLLSIINDILDFSKIESGKIEIIDTNYSLPSLINDVVSVIKIRLIDKPIHLSVNVDPLIPNSLIGDEVRIRQMLTNLLSNAVKYTNEGFVALSITGDISENSVLLKIEIADSGIGIKEEDIGKLFGNFVQIDTVKNKGIEGTGLGLAITRELSRIMGGDISISSVYEKGSTFTLLLPQKFENYNPFAMVENADSKSVLLYETRPVYCNSLIKTFESLGVKYNCVDRIPLLFDNLHKYPYVFVSSFAYGSISPALLHMEEPPKLVILSDVTETSAPKTARVLSLPANALSVANVLNDITESFDGTYSTGASFTAPDAKVLIVDDILANLKVIEGLLLPYDMQVTLCASGSEAITLATDNKYDLVFMDHMMPGMDGIETTRHIRNMDGEYYQKLPIIALTANAVSGVKEMFVNNGMDDFLAKPIEITKLDSILDIWIPKEKKIKQAVAEIKDEKSDFVEMLKTIPELSVKKALAVVGGSESTYERIVKLSTRLLPDNIARLNDLIETNLSNYCIEVHGIKGVLNNIGAYRLGMSAFELEELSRKGDLDTCKMLHTGFINKLSEFSDKMHELIDKTTVIERAEGDLSVLRETLPKLVDAADMFDSALALEIISSFADYSFGEYTDNKIIEMRQAFEVFDFDIALALIKELLSTTG